MEQKKEEELLRQIQLVVEDSHDAIISQSLDGVITSWNGGATRMFGYSAEEAVGQSVLFLLPPELKEEMLALLSKIKAGEEVLDHDSVRLRKDGSRVNVGISLSPIKTDSGVIVGASIVERDITTRKWYEARIFRQDKLYAALSKCNKAIVHSINEDELFKQICTAAVQSGGMMMAWVGLLDEVSKQIKPVASFGADEKYLNNIQISAKAEDTFGNGPTGTAVRENRPVWCQDFENDPIVKPWRDSARGFGWRASAALPLLRNKIPVGSLTLYSDIVNAFDDDAQKLLVEMAADISFALDKFYNDAKQIKGEESLRQTHLIVENSYDAIIGETLDGVITSWNGGATRMFGYSAEEAIGQSVLFLLPPELKEEIPVLLAKIKAGEFIADYDSVMIRKDGTKIDVAFSGSPIKTEDGTVIGVSVVERDITVRKEGERRIKELNEVRNKFIGIISHQLRTPLTAINWSLEAVLDGDFGKLEETTHKFLQITHRASVEMTNRIHDLLTAMDIEEGRIKFEKEEVVIDSLVAAVMNEMAKKGELRGVLFKYTPPAKDIPVFEGDNEKIRTVITKLAENAIMYTKEGGAVDAKLGEAGGTIRFEVKDTGVGIPAQEQHRVFTRFFRASNASVMQADAFGLGLFISKSFIDQHHGKIGFESKEGKGSIFWVEIPSKA